jgi:NADH:ubiquinone oxidoreductase subunit E
VAVSTDSLSLRQRARQAIADQPYQTVTVLSSLLAVQDDMGYLPSEALDEVASRTGVSVNEVWGVASFYPNFRLTQPPQHLLEVCWGPTCHLLGAQPLLQGLLAHLGLSQEGDTSDGTYALKLNTCLGACPHGPVIMVDGHLRGHMGLTKAVGIVDGLGAHGD